MLRFELTGAAESGAISMADIINLRRARKARARTEAEAQASANRARFGRTKAETRAAKAEADRIPGPSTAPNGTRPRPANKASRCWAKQGCRRVKRDNLLDTPV